MIASPGIACQFSPACMMYATPNMKVVCGVLGGYQVCLPNLVTGVRQMENIILRVMHSV